jgi:Tol biopolymer transport system component
MVAFDSDNEPGMGGGSWVDGFTWDRATNAVRRLTADGPGTRFQVRVSGDGGTVVFGTEQAMVPEDTDGAYDVYLADAATGSITSVSSGPDAFDEADVTDDGQRVVYVRAASGDEPDRLLAWDRPTGTTTEVADLGGSGSDHRLSDDGSRLTFVSGDDGIVPGDQDGLADLFLVDLGTGAVTLLETGDGQVLGADLSGDGRTVAFMSETNDFLPPGEADANGRGDLFTIDVGTGEVDRLTNGNAPSGTLWPSPSISDDGRAITFASIATDIASGEQDTGEGSDLFYWNADTGLISRLTRGPGVADFGTFRSSISGDGRTVVFVSTYNDLSPARPLPGGWDMFLYVWDRIT